MVPVLPSWNLPSYNESFNKKRRARRNSSVVLSPIPKNDDFPQKYKIQGYLIFIFVLLLAIIIAHVIFMSRNSDYNPKDFYEPCRISGILNVKEIIHMREDSKKLAKKLEVMKEILTYDLPSEAKPAVTHKLKLLSNSHQKLEQKIKFQIAHRTNCYQSNAQSYLEANDNQQQLVNIVYCCFQALFLMLLWYYILIIRTYNFSSSQNTSYKLYVFFAVILLILHAGFGVSVFKSYIKHSAFDNARIKEISDF